jgi:PleD family two-component response regulator
MAPRLARILIVDHSPKETAAVQGCLAGEDRIVVVAEEARGLMATVAEFSPHLILVVAASNFAVTCRQCRAVKDKYPETLVMATCLFSELHEIERIVEAGVDEFLSAPIHDAELRQRVDNLLRLAGCL